MRRFVVFATLFAIASGQAPSCNLTDTVVVIDSSQSITGEKYAQVKNYASDLMDRVVTDNNGSRRFAMIVFTEEVKIEWELPTFANSKSQLLNATRSMLHYTGITNMEIAFIRALSMLLQARPGACKALILFSDGYVNTARLPVAMAQYMRERMNVHMLAVAVDGINGWLAPYNVDALVKLTADPTAVIPLDSLVPLKRLMLNEPL